jgi:hypothetical protein
MMSVMGWRSRAQKHSQFAVVRGSEFSGGQVKTSIAVAVGMLRRRGLEECQWPLAGDPGSGFVGGSHCEVDVLACGGAEQL